MKNKKGFLLAEETLKIVIALICIGFLVYFLTSLYFKNETNKDLELAEASLDKLIEEINSGALEFEIYNPKGWWIMSWPYTSSGGTIYIPNSCSGQTCLCICDKGSTTTTMKGLIEDCDEEGVCVENTENLEVKGSDPLWVQSIQIKNPPLFLKYDNVNKVVSEK